MKLNLIIQNRWKVKLVHTKNHILKWHLLQVLKSDRYVESNNLNLFFMIIKMTTVITNSNNTT